jgi:large subunit ribosomal protein L25
VKKSKLEVQKRKVLGQKVKKLRLEGFLPANIYGKKIKSTAVQVNLKDFEKVYREAGETGVVELRVKGEKKTRPVLIHNLQVHPVTNGPLHADFHQISLKEKTTVEVPIELIGEAPAEKEGIGILVTLFSSLEVEALPTDLPEKLEVDITKLEKVDDVVRVKDIKVDKKKVKILANENEIVAKIEPPAKEEAPPEEEKPEEAKPEEEAAEETKPEEPSSASESEAPKGKEEKVGEKKEEEKKENLDKSSEEKRREDKESA